MTGLEDSYMNSYYIHFCYYSNVSSWSNADFVHTTTRQIITLRDAEYFIAIFTIDSLFIQAEMGMLLKYYKLIIYIVTLYVF